MASSKRNFDQISIAQIRAFVTAARASNFSRAAKEMGVTRAYISRVVKTMESRLGIQLFHRTTRDVSLTSTGKELLAGFSDALNTIDVAAETASSKDAGLEGVIRLSTSNAFGVHYILPLADKFMARHPGIKVEVDLSEEIDNLIRGKLDLVIRIGPLEDSSLVCRKLGGLGLVLAVPQALVARHGLPKSVADLAKMPAVEFKVPGTGRIFQWQFEIQGKIHQYVPENVIGTFHAPEMMLTAVMAGRGMTPLPRYLIESAINSQIVTVGLPDHPIPSVPVSICFPAQKIMSARLRTFVDFLVAESPDVF